MPTLDQIKKLPHYYRITVSPEHLDALDHLNVQHYLAFFEQGGWGFMDSIGIGMDYLENEQKSIMALRHVISYIDEVRLGQELTCYGRMLAVDHKRFHLIEYMVNESANTLAATLEILAIHADLVKRKSVPWKPETLNVLQILLAEHQNLDWEAEVSGGIN